ncbi:echinoidin-like isoform X2 [Clupea harengus]|uniref:Echinoidin-like isoform X2 n=1 Tax=Clupea harengus TaxID=7950 RepID=A0A8M1KJ96_CLUHA|nr:echinoidin-like isoform X2 [Clupea harengus]
MSDPVIYAEVKYKKGLDPNTTRSGPQTKAPVPADSSPKDRSEDTGRRGLLRLAVVVLCILILGAVIGLSLYYISLGSSAGCQSGKCADGWKSHGRQCYFFSEKKLTWTQSRDECVRMRSHLAIIHDEDEQTFLMRELNMTEAEDKFWIGLNDRETEGQWLWVDNTPLNTSFWMGNEPDNWTGDYNEYPDGEDCVRMGEENFDGKGVNAWVDTACERKFKFICETETC